MKFLKASFQGWIYCRDHQAACVNIVLDERPDARRGPPGVADERDQRAHLAEPERHRAVPAGRVAQTAAIAKKYGVIKSLAQGRDELRVRARRPSPS